MGIRLASKKDFAEIMEIIRDAKNFIRNNGCSQWNTPDGYPTKSIILNDILKQQLYVFEQDKIKGIMVCILGKEASYEHIHGSWLTSDSPYLTIHRLAVKQEFHHTGISGNLVNFAEQLALKLGCNSIRVDTHPLNIPMQNLLSKHNYKKCGYINITSSKTDTLRIAYEKLL